MLRASFYKTTGSVEGIGLAAMTLGGGTVEVKLSEANKGQNPSSKSTMGGFSTPASATSTTTNVGNKKQAISVTATTSSLGNGN